MKVTYYNYQFLHDGTSYLNSAVDLLRKFEEHGNTQFKSGFKNSNGDSLFLFKETNSLYSLIVTKDSELIKKINSEKLTYEDLKDDLNENEQIGFASYIFIEKDHYAIASTVQGPKNKSFVDFMNQLLEKLHLNIEFLSNPFPTKISRDDVLALDYVGKTTFEIQPSNKAFKSLGQLLGITALPNELNSIEITIKPARGADIKGHIPAINEKLGDDNLGIKKYLVSAKESMEDNLTDFYITGNGFVSDIIDGDKRISTQIAESKSKNENLKIKLLELKKDTRYKNAKIKDLYAFNLDPAWIIHISSHYADESEQYSSKVGEKG